MLTPPTVTVPEAFTVAWPAVLELTITVHVPAAVVLPVGPQVPPVIEPAPEDVDVLAPLPAGLPPGPSFVSTRTVNGCAWPTSFVPLWLIVIRASTHVLPASAPSPTWVSPVVRVSETVRTDSVVVARTVEVPTTFALICTVHDPVVPTVRQKLGPSKAPTLPARSEKLICVPAGALT